MGMVGLLVGRTAVLVGTTFGLVGSNGGFGGVHVWFWWGPRALDVGLEVASAFLAISNPTICKRLTFV